jgi:aryl-alcohol dehydrogenase-like predicted oxidoreductase
MKSFVLLTKQRNKMEYRNLGKSGLKVPVLSLGTGTFGGTTEFFQRWGETDAREASRLVDICLERGMAFFDTANVYSLGAAEEILGKALDGKRDQAIISTKGTFAMGNGPNEKGSSRYHIIRAVEASLKRLATDYIDIYFMHGYDSTTPIEETLSTLDTLVRSGKVRYMGCSNFAAWQLMKSLSVSERHHYEKYVVYQGYYSLVGRDLEQELLPLLQEEGLGLMVWSPLGWGRLTGKMKRTGVMEEGRVKSGGLIGAPPVDDDHLFNVIDALEKVAIEMGKTVPQIALNWLIQHASVSNIIIGARNESQLQQNIEAVSFNLSLDQVNLLNDVSYRSPIYPHWVGER